MQLVQQLKKVLSEKLIEATPQKRTLKPVIKFLKELNERLKKIGCNAKATLGGSFAKGVWLEGDYDVDVFVQFNSPGNDNISEKLSEALKGLNFDRVHGSRDYYKIKKYSFTFEIVPVIKIKNASQAINVTDASPLHVRWVLKNGKKLQADIRLAKLFCKSIKIYGAESFIGGFSGHALDILIIYYGGFEKFLRRAEKWGQKVIIDPEKHYDANPLRYMNKSKTEGPLVIVDPLDKNRNSAAAVRKETFEKLKKEARKFLRKPSKKFFETKMLKVPKNSIVLTVETIKGKYDVVGSKYLKMFKELKKGLAPFEVLHSEWEWTEGKKPTFVYKLKKEKIENIEMIGPPIKMRDAAEKFRKSHKNVKKIKGRLIAVEPSKAKTPIDTISIFSRTKNVKVDILNDKTRIF
ncbi:nucleotidyltransferase domain-containing protein [Candidatus Woesearchaeota archaeon]|nr:nucleotidyltransferase domain-containing protein [Candidatus Woesearchaeota archaeon]